MTVNGTGVSETMSLSSAGERVHLLRDSANVALDLGGLESVVVNALGGDDVVTASGLEGALLKLTADGGDGADVLVGSDADDTLRGGLGDDVLIGGPGTNVAFDTLGANTVTAATAVGAEWVKANAVPVRGGGIVLDLGGRRIALPPAELAQL